MGRFSGFTVTIRELFRRPVTSQYPAEKRVMPPPKAGATDSVVRSWVKLTISGFPLGDRMGARPSARQTRRRLGATTRRNGQTSRPALTDRRRHDHNHHIIV